ncbi:MAG: hypothetical protein KAI22_07745 [Gammaproteobacteria bacterium]|nr:hypothetical protein [Gammaproteobacteria bacterium]
MSFIQSRQSIFLISILTAVIIWFGESLVHFFILDQRRTFELLPNDLNELWMRAIICGLIIIFGIYSQIHSNKKMDLEAEKMRTLKATMNTVHDLVGNSLAGIKLLLGEPNKNNIVDKETHKKLIKLIDETFSSLRDISNIEEINEKQFHNEIYHLEINK